MRDLCLAIHQFRFDQKRFWRDPAGVFYALAFPLLFLVIFGTVLGVSEENGRIAGREVDNSVYYFAAVLTMGLVTVNLVNLAISLTASRERGLLKRLRATPLPPWIFMAGRIATSVFVTLILVVITTVVGRVFYGVPLNLTTLPAVLVTLCVATSSFCALGAACTLLAKSEAAAAALTNLVAFPLFFLSGLFMRNDILPSTIQRLADFFPVKHVFAALAVGFDPNTAGLGFRGWDLGIVAIWGAAGLLVALLRFRWAPRSG